mgnify:FL=1|jgi:hypothetical protein
MLLASEVFFSFQLAVLVAVLEWCMADGMILSAYRMWLERKAFEWQYGWITKPMGLCSFCTAGQVGLWTGVFMLGFYPFEIILFACFTMFFDKIRVEAIKA